MVLNRQELSLNIKPTYVPKTISDFLGEVTMIGNVSEKLLKLDDFIKRLEEEMRKIDAFKRELPLSMILVNDAIAILKEEVMQYRKPNVVPLFEEFIPLKKSCDQAEKDEIRKDKDSRDKKNWMSAVQLWNNTDHPNTDSNYNQIPNSVAEINKINEQKSGEVSDELYQLCKRRREGKEFLPFKAYSAISVMGERMEEKKLPVVGLSLLTPGIKSLGEELECSVSSSKTSSFRAVSCSSPNVQSNLQTTLHPPQQQTSRKQRRCWSSELHRLFINALQQLGGPLEATPKQIRELMQVDDLTNNEVKSHLQKYRLHTLRPPSTTATPSNQSAITLGGLWMPHDESGESSKRRNSHYGSPKGPLQLTETTGGTSTTRGDCMEDERSESCSWK